MGLYELYWEHDKFNLIKDKNIFRYLINSYHILEQLTKVNQKYFNF